MSEHQLKLNFRPLVIDTGKKSSRLTCSCSDEFTDLVEKIAAMRNVSKSELIYEYIVIGLKGDVGEIFLNAQHLDKPVREFINKKF